MLTEDAAPSAGSHGCTWWLQLLTSLWVERRPCEPWARGSEPRLETVGLDGKEPDSGSGEGKRVARRKRPPGHETELEVAGLEVSGVWHLSISLPLPASLFSVGQEPS